MRILFVAATYPPNINGASLATQRLAEGLAAKGHEVSVIAPSTSFKRYKKREGKLTIYRVRSVPLFLERVQELRVSPTPLHAKEIKNIIEEVRPDIIHISEPWFMGVSAISAAKDFGIPVISTHHFMPENFVHYLHLPERIEKIVNRNVWRWYARVYKNLALVICPSQKAADILEGYNQGVEIKVVSNGIDLQKFNSRNKGGYLKKRYKILQKPVILFLGRLDKEKNVDVFIRALGLLKDRCDFSALIVGQGKEKKSLRRLASTLGVSDRIIFTGYLAKKDLPNIYTVADIFVMPGTAELQSLVTMEAMASGLPVIGADAVALPHLIHTNKNGFLFSPGDENDLAKKLEALLINKRLRGRMAKESVEIIKEHDIKSVIEKNEAIYSQVISKNKVIQKKAKIKKRNVLKRLKKITLEHILEPQI